MPSQMHSERGIAATIGNIDAAAVEPELRAGVDAARKAVVAELTAHTPTMTLAAAWSEVMRHTVAVAARLVAHSVVPAEKPVGWTWFVSGSVARGEAIPGSDVETLIALDDSVDAAGQSAVMELAADVHLLLERCGLRLDANGVLASRGRFCRTRAGWAEGIERWCAEPGEDRGVVMAGLLADTTGVSAPVNVADNELRSQTIEQTRQHPAARRAMLQDATAVRAAIPSRLRVFATQADSVDLKLAAVEPIVKIARWAALSSGSKAISTLTRLDDAASAKVLDADDASSLRECYQSLSRIRWRTRAGPWIEGKPVTDTVVLSDLAPQERAAVRTVAREVNGIRRKLDFLASTSSFR